MNYFHVSSDKKKFPIRELHITLLGCFSDRGYQKSQAKNHR